MTYEKHPTGLSTLANFETAKIPHPIEPYAPLCPGGLLLTGGVFSGPLYPQFCPGGFSGRIFVCGPDGQRRPNFGFGINLVSLEIELINQWLVVLSMGTMWEGFPGLC